ncbi:MAG: flagellar biosynthesis protein FlhA [Bacillota bacterium]|nr:flagellar biosynthesis protein FlhA [Bacillota bacterium]
MMIVPLHPDFLSVLLVFNITIAILILLVAMYTKEPLDFSIFPSLLLITTLLRLSLNVSSTRLILLHADAGEVIRQFGNFVIGGNPGVGFVVFLILVIIQFLVITKGSERVAEVAARFTLDAMPGKQMSIDADLNAGLISDDDARERRKKIQREADFYGAMDGASKFVKGDAIAGIIITIINIIAGLIVGILQHEMPAGEALNTFALLTVGDGLVTQIPALLISTATGIVVTRAASDTNLGHDLIGQIINQPKVLIIVTGVLVFLGMVPGLPAFPFLLLAAILGTTAYFMDKSEKEKSVVLEEKAEEQEIEESRKVENVMGLLNVDQMELELGYGLIPLVDLDQGGDLLDRVVMIRRQCALEMGLLVPPIRMRDNMQLKPNMYVIKIKGVDVANGELLLDHYLAMGSDMEANIPGVETVEPAFGLPAKWITEAYREEAEMSGYTVVDSPSVLATHLTEIIKNHAHEILGRQEVQNLLDHVKTSNPAVVNELVPNILSIGEVQKVLANLLRERVQIRDMVTILETLADYGSNIKDLDVLTEYVRQALARSIIKPYLVENNTLPVITLAPKLEQEIKESIQYTDHGNYLALDPARADHIFDQLRELIEKAVNQNYQPVILCAPIARFYLKRLTERAIPGLVIISYNELDMNVEVQAIGMVT